MKKRNRSNERTVGWDRITLVPGVCTDDHPGLSVYPASGPTPADLAEMLIDGNVPTDEDRCQALEFLEALTPYPLKVAFFRSLVRGTEFTKADLARESGLTETGVAKALARAARRAWGEVPR